VKELDLHGIRHHDVDRIVENFVFNVYPSQAKIITGNSMRMKKIVKMYEDFVEFQLEKLIEGDIDENGFTSLERFMEKHPELTDMIDDVNKIIKKLSGN